MSNDQRQSELMLAEQIVSVLPEGSVARVVTGDRNSISYRIHAAGMQLNMIMLRRESLSRLILDPQREVKLEYLKRELLLSAGRRTTFSYPRAWTFGGFVRPQQGQGSTIPARRGA